MESNDEVTIDLHNYLYKTACDLIWPYLGFDEVKDTSSEMAQSAVRQGCKILERVILINPKNWSAMWVMGMGWKAIKEFDPAYDAFKRGLVSNYGLALLINGQLAEAEDAVNHSLQMAPSDPKTLMVRDVIKGIRAIGCPHPTKWPPDMEYLSELSKFAEFQEYTG